jgi:D-alanyl-D-alanine carboxypeptidase
VVGFRAGIAAAAVVALAACSSGSGAQGATTTAPATKTTILASTTTTAVPVAAPTAADVSAVLDQWIQANQVPGAVAAVRVGTGAPVIVSAGVDAKSGAPLDAHVPFAVASITKTFTGALALHLVDRGRLGLDDSLKQYVPTFPNADRITIRELLSHTSGLPPLGGDAYPDQYSEAFQKLVLANLDKSFTPDEILDFVRDRPLLFTPGEGVEYSNVNTILLAKVVEKVAGIDVTHLFHQQLIDPLGLTHTFYAATETGPDAAPGVFKLTDDGPLLKTADFPSRGLLSAIGVAGGMVSNVDDLLTWGEHYLREGAVGHVDLAQSRFQVDATKGVGLGVIVWNPDVGGCAFNGGCPSGSSLLGVMGAGSLPGTNSVVAYFPKWDVTIVGIANSNLVDVDHGLLRLLLEKVVGPVS